MLFDEEKYIYISLDYRPRGLYLMVVQHTASPLVACVSSLGLGLSAHPFFEKGAAYFIAVLYMGAYFCQ